MPDFIYNVPRSDNPSSPYFTTYTRFWAYAFPAFALGSSTLHTSGPGASTSLTLTPASGGTVSHSPAQFDDTFNFTVTPLGTPATTYYGTQGGISAAASINRNRGLSGTLTVTFGPRVPFGTYQFSVAPAQSARHDGTPDVANDLLFPGAQTFTVVYSGSSSSSSNTSSAQPGGVAFARDAHHRPLFAAVKGPSSSGGSVYAELHLQTTQDAGHTYQDHLCLTAPANASDPSLIVDPYLNTFRLVYYDGAGLVTSLAALDGERGDWGPAAALAGVTGRYPVCAPHPTDRRTAALLCLSGGSLNSALSYDGGKTWKPNAAPVDAGLDFGASGRAGACWLGDWLLAAYAKGTGLSCRLSPDRGQSWGPINVVSAAAPSRVSAQAQQGTLYVLATLAGAAAPTLLSSASLGRSWAARSAPAVAAPALGLLPDLGRLLLGTGEVSDTDGRDWRAP